MKRLGAVIIVVVFAFQGPGFALTLTYPFFEDPLRTNLSVLDKGVILPGDTVPVQCPSPKDFSHPLALGEAVDIALCNNPQIKASWANIKVHARALGEARSAYLPSATASLNRTFDRTTYPGSKAATSELYRTTFQGGVNWRIFDFGGRSANHRAAEQMLAAALASHNATLQRALSDVAQSYFDATTAKAAFKAAAETEENARATLTSAKVREERGAISQIDRLRATTALAQATLEHNRADGEYRLALAVLGQVLGLPAGTTIALPEDISANAEEIGQDLNVWLEDAQKNHPAIVAARAQVETAQNQVTVARSAGLPTFNFVGNYYRNTKPGEAVTVNEAREYTLGIGLSIPFFDGFSNTYKIRGAEARVEQRKAELMDTETRVALELVRAYSAATSALQNLGASANLLRAAQEALAASRRRYDKGAADITEILSTQSNLSVAERERIKCLAEWNSARLKLLASAGQMGRSAVHSPLETDMK